NYHNKPEPRKPPVHSFSRTSHRSRYRRLLRHILETMAAARATRVGALNGAGTARPPAPISADIDTVHSVCRMPRTVERCIGGERPDCPSADSFQFPFSRLRAKFGHKRPILGADAIRIIQVTHSKCVRVCNDKSSSKLTASYCISSSPFSSSDYEDKEWCNPTGNY